MPFRKFTPLPKDQACRHPEHNPPGMIVLREGIHEYECPACGKVTVLRIQRPRMSVPKSTQTRWQKAKTSWMRTPDYDKPRHPDTGCKRSMHV